MSTVKAQAGGSYNGVVGDASWTHFLAGGSKGISKAVIVQGGRRVKLTWVDGHESEFSLKWLRDHGNGSFDLLTSQRQVDTFSISNDSLIKHASMETMSAQPSSDTNPSVDAGNQSQQVLLLRWAADGSEAGDDECTVPIATLRKHCNSEIARSLRKQFGASTEVPVQDVAPVLWGNDLFTSTSGTTPATFEYKDLMEYDQQESSSSSSPQSPASHLMRRLKTHGFALVRGVPTDVEGTKALGLKFGGHLMSSLYGKETWGISKDAVEEDALFRNLAYTTDSLALHTDLVYLSEPPGIQVFSCRSPAVEGGASIYVDGFAVAERLRKEYPEAYEFLTKTSLTYESLDEGYHYLGGGPMFRIGPLGVVDQVRFNDHHRSPLNYLPPDDVDRFYEYHKIFIGMTRDPSMMSRIILEAGDTVIFNNHRALHGRESYKGARRMAACYIGMDEAKAEARKHGI